MKKITITNAYTWYNKGDAGILLGIIRALKEEYINEKIEINILSFSPQIDKLKYSNEKVIKEVQSNILNPHPYKHTKIGKIIAITKLFFRMIKIYIESKISLDLLVHNEISAKLLKESDIIVVCGGGFLGGKKFDSLMHLFQIYINTLFNKPVIIMGTSIEPIKNNIIKKYTEKILKKVDYIFAREKITYDYLKKFMPKEKFTLIPDMAFILDEKKQNFEAISKLKKKTNMIFGITVRNWNFPDLEISRREKAMRNYENTIKDVMKKFINENDSYFVFIPQVIVDTGDDTIIAKHIKSMLTLKEQEHFIIIEDDLSPIQIKSLIGNMDYFIGTRMHSNIFATSMKIPTIAIAYEKKTNGIMQTVGLEKYIVEICDINSATLINKINECIKNNKEIKEILNDKIPEIKKEIVKKISKVMKNY